MKKRLLSLCLILIMVLEILPMSALAASKTVQIGDEKALMDFSSRVNGGERDLDAVLTNDVEVTVMWTPIGMKAHSYSGIFDGKGHTVTISGDITYKDTNERYGFFNTVSGTIRNLIVAGKVDLNSKAGNVGGIAGYLDGGTVTACLNKAEVTGKNNVGGIVGMSSKGTVLSCGNSGNIQTSGSGTSTNAGGIVGSNMGGTIKNCYNTGKIAAASNYAGGIAGANSAFSAPCSIENSYTTGKIDESNVSGAVAGTESGTKGITYSNVFYLADCATKAIGKTGSSTGAPESKAADSLKTSVLALKDSSDNAVFFADPTPNINGGYPVLAWQLPGEPSGDKLLSGGLTVSGKLYAGGELTANYSGAETVTYQWYRGNTAIDGANQITYNVLADDVGSELNVRVSANGYTAKKVSVGTVPDYVAFVVTPDTAAVTVVDSENKVWSAAEGIYSLPKGDYTYTVAANGEYEDVSGSFNVTGGGNVITVDLTVKAYDVCFTVSPDNADFTVKKNGSPVAPSTPGTKVYKLPKGSYTYSVSAFGYESKIDVPYTVDGTAADTIKLTTLPLRAVSISAQKTAGGPDTEPVVIVRDETGVVRDYTKGLPSGNYTYSIACGGYQSVSGAFIVGEEDVSIFKMLILQSSSSWDGSTYTEPVRDAADVYLIGSAEELMWFSKNAALDASAKLISDVTINADMTAAESALYQWVPIGRYEASVKKAYTGTFDGQSHTISGLYVSVTGNKEGAAGFVANLGAEGTITNLTVRGLVSCSGSKSTVFVGGIVGTGSGTIDSCVNRAQVRDTGNGSYHFAGGIAGETNGSAIIKNCANLATVHNENNYAGGIVGQLNSGSASAVSGCYNAGHVEGKSYVGGLVGHMNGASGAPSILNAFNTGSISAAGYCGGIVGDFRYGYLGRAYSCGKITSGDPTKAGALVGKASGGSVSKSVANTVYYTGDTAIADSSGSTITNSASGITHDELKALATALGDAFSSDTENINGGYPVLKWQTCEITKPDAPETNPAGWDGSDTREPALKDGIYQIGCAAELAWFAEQLKTHNSLNAVLTVDIDLNNQPWTPMCGATQGVAFSGSFNGAGHSVKNLYISNGKAAAALFAGNAGTIQNLSVTGLVRGADYASALAAYNYGLIKNCSVSAAVSGGNYAGGVISRNFGTICDSAARGSVTAVKYAGGVAASNASGGMVTCCSNTGLVKSASDFSGGICAANEGTVSACYNTGLVAGYAGNLHSYVGGIVGWNNGLAENLYNNGSVVSCGSYAGGTVGISTTGATAKNLYGIGCVMGMYYDDADGNEQYYVGSVAGRKTDNVQNAYYLKTLSVTGGGTAKSEAELKAEGFPVQLGNAFVQDKARLNGGYPVLTWQTAQNTAAALPAVTGTITISGELKSGGMLTAAYDGNAKDPLFVWYTADEDGEYVLAMGSGSYLVPVDQVGKLLRVRVFSFRHSSYVSAAASGRIEGMDGSVFLKGSAVVGKTLTASYSNKTDAPQYQWYRGNTPIPDATSGSYTVCADDIGYLLKVRVTGNKPGHVEKAMSTKIITAEKAGVWPDEDCTEPANVGGVYVITSEKELCWFVSEVNGGNSALKAKLSNDLSLTVSSWYPIGTDNAPFTGTFDGNGKAVVGLTLATDKGEQGFFGVVGGKGEVKNLTVSGNVTATGDNAISIGGIAGCVEGCVSGCTFNGRVNGTSQVGGIAGLIGLHGMVTECRNTATVTGSSQVGGIAGGNSYGDTYYCVNNGTVGGPDAENVGGIVGDTQNYAVITGCYNTGSVTGKTQVGGISGKVYVASAPLGCYNVGSVKGGYATGGVLGSIGGTDYISITTGSFYLNTLPKDSSAFCRSESTMKDSAFVTALNNNAFVECYTADNGSNNGFPILKWEKDGHASSGGSDPNLPTKDRITVSFTLLGDTVHEDGAHTGGTIIWISKATVSGLPITTTAYDLFRQMLDENDYDYEAKGNSYVAFITSPDKIRLGEFSNGPYSGWMYTVNGVFPDYMSATTLKDGDDMVFFYTDDYRKTGWNPNGKPGESSSNGSYGNEDANTGGTVTINPTATVSSGKASVMLGASDLSSAISRVKGNSGSIVIEPKINGNAKMVTIGLPKASLASIAADTSSNLTVQTPAGNVTFSNEALSSIAAQATDDTVAVNLGTVDKTALSAGQQIAVGDGMVYDISVLSGSTKISTFGGGSITVSLPYTLKSGEDASGVTVWHMDDSGRLLRMSATYDETKGTATFTTPHLSYYIVGCTTPWTNPFGDVKSTDWFYNAVKYVSQKSLMSGMSGAAFEPDTGMTRAMIVTVLYRMDGKPAATGTNVFTDVEAGQWYTDAVTWASENKIVGGYGRGLFGTEDGVTREQLAAILYNYAMSKGYDVTKTADLKSYTDAAAVDSWAKDAMMWAVGTGLITGTTSTTLNSHGTATRAQVATILQRFIEENVAK